MDYLPDSNDPNIRQATQEIMEGIRPHLRSADEGHFVEGFIKEAFFRYESHARAPVGALPMVLAVVLALIAGYFIGNGSWGRN